MQSVAYIDGGRVPGAKKIAIGGVIFTDGHEITRYSDIAGDGSNSDAEWHSLIRCLEMAIDHGISSLHILTDFRPIGDMLLSEYEMLQTMIVNFEHDPQNKGLQKAIGIRTREHFRSLLDMKKWLELNKTLLKIKTTIPALYGNKITCAFSAFAGHNANNF
jgi:ribonuclease HI